MKLFLSGVLLASLVVLPSFAHADTELIVANTLGGAASGIAFTSIDLLAAPRSKIYGVTEAVVNGAFTVGGVINFATMSGKHGDAVKPIVAGVALWNAILMTHGIYVLMRSTDEPAPAPAVAFTVGRARVALAPTAVTDGLVVGGGLAAFGSF